MFSSRRETFTILLSASASLALLLAVSVSVSVWASTNTTDDARAVLGGAASQNLVIAEVAEPSIRDSVLYKPRWSLPSNGSLEKIEANSVADDSEDADSDKRSAKNRKNDGDGDAQPEILARPRRLKPGQISHIERLNLDDSSQQIEQKIAKPEANVRAAAKSKISALVPSSAKPAPSIGAPIPGATQPTPVNSLSAPSVTVPSLSSLGSDDPM